MACATKRCVFGRARDATEKQGSSTSHDDAPEEEQAAVGPLRELQAMLNAPPMERLTEDEGQQWKAPQRSRARYRRGVYVEVSAFSESLALAIRDCTQRAPISMHVLGAHVRSVQCEL